MRHCAIQQSEGLRQGIRHSRGNRKTDSEGHKDSAEEGPKHETERAKDYWHDNNVFVHLGSVCPGDATRPVTLYNAREQEMVNRKSGVGFRPQISDTA